MVGSSGAGWSSLAARRAHNPKVVGSNPTPATNQIKWLESISLRHSRRNVPLQRHRLAGNHLSSANREPRDHIVNSRGEFTALIVPTSRIDRKFSFLR